MSGHSEDTTTRVPHLAYALIQKRFKTYETEYIAQTFYSRPYVLDAYLGRFFHAFGKKYMTFSTNVALFHKAF